MPKKREEKTAANFDLHRDLVIMYRSPALNAPNRAERRLSFPIRLRGKGI